MNRSSKIIYISHKTKVISVKKGKKVPDEFPYLFPSFSKMVQNIKYFSKRFSYRLFIGYSRESPIDLVVLKTIE